MPSPEHEAYQNALRAWCRSHRRDRDVRRTFSRHSDALLVLWHLDLEPARPVLQACYAPSPRGGDPRDPIVMLRCLLLALLVGQPSLNKWVDDLGASSALCVIAGLDDDDRPGVGTFYDFLHRLHDGPIRQSCEHVERPSDVERRRSRTPRQRPTKPKKTAAAPKKRRGKSKKGGKATNANQPAIDPGVTAKLAAQLKAASELPNAMDLLGRLSTILLEVGVLESARRGLLGDPSKLIVGGDGSPLVTGASRYGRKTCSHPRYERCDCPKIYSDPDAQIGWDAHRERFFFGHHFYELSCSVSGHDLPLAIRLDPGNASDHTASLLAIEHLRKNLRDLDGDLAIDIAVHDCGHDAEPFYRFLIDFGMRPVIPLRHKAPATHPTRPEVTLSPRGIPLCEAKAEMAPWGSAGPDRQLFLCPLRAGKLDRCPLAPDDHPEWRCRPDKPWSPVISLRTSHNPRLCPPIPRNSSRYQEYMNLRSGCERSNAVKKETFRLEDARHRRASFWLIRLHLIALLQHAKVWVAALDAQALLDDLFGEKEQPALAA